MAEMDEPDSYETKNSSTFLRLGDGVWAGQVDMCTRYIHESKNIHIKLRKLWMLTFSFLC